MQCKQCVCKPRFNRRKYVVRALNFRPASWWCNSSELHPAGLLDRGNGGVASLQPITFIASLHPNSTLPDVHWWAHSPMPPGPFGLLCLWSFVFANDLKRVLYLFTNLRQLLWWKSQKSVNNLSLALKLVHRDKYTFLRPIVERVRIYPHIKPSKPWLKCGKRKYDSVAPSSDEKEKPLTKVVIHRITLKQPQLVNIFSCPDCPPPQPTPPPWGGHQILLCVFFP